MNASYDENIGRYLISNDLGIGEIIEVQNISDSGLFYNVEFPKSNMKNYFAVESSKFRIVASEGKIKDAIKIFKEDPLEKSFSSIKDEIQFYKTALKTKDVCELAGVLGNLNINDNIHQGIKTTYKRVLDSFLEEVKVVLQLKDKEVRDMLGVKASA